MLLVSQTEINLRSPLNLFRLKNFFVFRRARVVVASSIEISIEHFRSCIGSHDNFAKTKTYFVLTEGLVRYFPGNKSILKVHSLNSNNFMRR